MVHGEVAGSPHFRPVAAMNNCGTRLVLRYFIAAVLVGVPKELNSSSTSSDSTSLRVCSMVRGGL